MWSHTISCDTLRIYIAQMGHTDYDRIVTKKIWILLVYFRKYLDKNNLFHKVFQWH